MRKKQNRVGLLLLCLALAWPATAGAQYTGAYSRNFHASFHKLSQHLVVVSSMTMYLASKGLAQKKGRAKTIKYLTTYLKTSSMALIELRTGLTGVRQAFLEASSKKVKARLFKGRRASRKDVKRLVHKYVAGLDNFYALSGNMVQRFTSGNEQKEMARLIVVYRNQVRGIANSF